MTVLIAFATGHGSTRGIAEKIGAVLRDRGIATEVKEVAAVTGVSGYDAVILGSAVHGSRWLPEATHFVTENAASLRQRPTWLFNVSTIGDEESAFVPRVAKRMRALGKMRSELTALDEAIRPREHRDFAGVVSRSDWPAPARVLFRATGGRYGDFRNWPAIEAWASEIATDLVAQRPAPTNVPGSP